MQLTLDGYEPWTTKVTVKEGENLPIRAELKLKPSIPAEIKQFSATPETIQQGHSTKLSWTTQDATEVSIDPEYRTGLCQAERGTYRPARRRPTP